MALKTCGAQSHHSTTQGQSLGSCFRVLSKCNYICVVTRKNQQSNLIETLPTSEYFHLFWVLLSGISFTHSSILLITYQICGQGLGPEPIQLWLSESGVQRATALMFYDVCITTCWLQPVMVSAWLECQIAKIKSVLHNSLNARSYDILQASFCFINYHQCQLGLCHIKLFCSYTSIKLLKTTT